MLYFLKSWGFNNINYDILMLHTQRERLELFFCQHSYFCSGLTAKDVLNSCSESTRIIYNVIQFAETDRREWCKAFYRILVVLTKRRVAIKSRALLDDKLKNVQQLSVLFYWNLNCYQYVQLQSNNFQSRWRISSTANKTIICPFPLIALTAQNLWGVVVMSLLLLLSCGFFLWQPTVIGTFFSSAKYTFHSLFRPGGVELIKNH